jgi:N-acetylglucosaminyl-diphospho-decaprenol L-rhamnosyltransferase
MGSPVLIVIVNYRTAGLAIDCLNSIAADRSSYPSIRAAVVDNDSKDGSVERLSAAIAANRWERWAGVTPSGRNGGFAAGNNVALRQELAKPAADRARYVMLLNPDTVLRPGAIEALSGFLDDHPEVGVAGSRIEDAHGRTQGSARHFPSPLGEFVFTARVGHLTRLLRRYSVVMAEGDRPMKCDWVSGAAMTTSRRPTSAAAPLRRAGTSGLCPPRGWPISRAPPPESATGTGAARDTGTSRGADSS